jgi:hypothetical protein
LGRKSNPEDENPRKIDQLHYILHFDRAQITCHISNGDLLGEEVRQNLKKFAKIALNWNIE